MEKLLVFVVFQKVRLRPGIICCKVTKNNRAIVMKVDKRPQPESRSNKGSSPDCLWRKQALGNIGIRTFRIWDGLEFLVS